MNRFLMLAIAGCVILPAQEKLPPAAAVIDRYIEATGGKAAYEKHQNQIAKGTLSFPAQGISGAMTMTMAEPSNTSTKVEIGAIGTMQEGVSGDVAWEVSPMQGPRIVEGAERADVLREARFNAPIHWREQYSKAETQGVERVGDEDCVKVLMTPSDGGHPETMYFSRKTGLLIKQTGTRATAMGDFPFESDFSDYRPVDGVLEPFKTAEKAAGQEIQLTISSLQFNVDLPPSAFEMPAEIQTLVKKQKAQPPERSGSSPAAPEQSGTSNPK